MEYQWINVIREQGQEIPDLCHLSEFSNTGPVHSNQWRYVETFLNPADKASRGMTVDTLLRNNCSSQDTPFLKQPKETWLQRPAISVRSLTATQTVRSCSQYMYLDLYCNMYYTPWQAKSCPLQVPFGWHLLCWEPDPIYPSLHKNWQAVSLYTTAFSGHPNFIPLVGVGNGEHI